jgi:hypothetical protein
MRTSIRLALASAVAFAGLAFAAPALAAYNPLFVIGQSSYQVTGQPGVAITVAQRVTDDPTAKITIYAPTGYTANLGQPAGTTIGVVTARVQAADLGGSVIPLGGPVTTDAPAKYTTSAARCTPGQPVHQAVWLLNASVAGQTIQIPVYVDHTSGPETAIGSVKIQVCLAPPDLPQGTPGRAAFGAKLVSAIFSVDHVFQNPSSGLANYVWRSLFTPYTPNTGRPNAAGTQEAQAVVPISYNLGLKRAKPKKRRTIRVTGRITAAGKAVSGTRLRVYLLRKNRLFFNGYTSKTNRKGRFSFSRKSSTKTRTFVVIRGGPVVSTGSDTAFGTRTQCLPLVGFGAVPCTSAYIAPRGAVIRVKGQKRRRR